VFVPIEDAPKAPRRVWVVGVAGSGKSTVAAMLAQRTLLPVVELDDLFWQPGWKRTPEDLFRASVIGATSSGEWIACGNYLSRLREILWAQADVVAWLDPPLPLALFRVERRTLRQARAGTKICNGNVNEIRHLWSADGPFRYTLRHGRELRHEYAEATAEIPTPVVRLRTPKEVGRWLDFISAAEM
jgi:hypothetical protein